MFLALIHFLIFSYTLTSLKIMIFRRFFLIFFKKSPKMLLTLTLSDQVAASTLHPKVLPLNL